MGRLSDVRGIGRLAVGLALAEFLLAAAFLVTLVHAPPARLDRLRARRRGTRRSEPASPPPARSAWSLGAVLDPLAVGASGDAGGLLSAAVAAAVLVPTIAASRRLRPLERAVD